MSAGSSCYGTDHRARRDTCWVCTTEAHDLCMFAGTCCPGTDHLSSSVEVADRGCGTSAAPLRGCHPSSCCCNCRPAVPDPLVRTVVLMPKHTKTRTALLQLHHAPVHDLSSVCNMWQPVCVGAGKWDPIRCLSHLDPILRLCDENSGFVLSH